MNSIIKSHLPKFKFSLYFLKGTDPRKLNFTQQLELNQFVKSNPQGNSFMVYNHHQANRIVENWFQKFPWIKPYYAIKASPSDMICRGLAAGGAGMDCASKLQIQQALKIGVSASSIIYSNCVKDQNDLKWAVQNNITLTTADTIDEIKKIKEIAPSMKILWRISVKQNQSDFLSANFSGKFGDDLNTKQMIHFRMKQLKNMGVRLEGIHFHCGSGYNGSSGFKKGIQLARSCLEIGRKYNHKMQIMDIGGGFPGGDISKEVVESIQVTKNDPLGYITMAEPGRHFSSRAFYLLVRVLAKRFKSEKPCYHVNDSVFHSFNCVLVDGVSFQGKDNRFYGKVQKVSSELQQTQSGALFGMTCDGIDIIAKSMMLPKQLSTNDWLCFSGMGSYTYSIKTTFNGMSTTQRFQYWSGNVHNQQSKQQQSIVIKI